MAGHIQVQVCQHSRAVNPENLRKLSTVVYCPLQLNANCNLMYIHTKTRNNFVYLLHKHLYCINHLIWGASTIPDACTSDKVRQFKHAHTYSLQGCYFFCPNQIYSWLRSLLLISFFGLCSKTFKSLFFFFSAQDWKWLASLQKLYRWSLTWLRLLIPSLLE